LSLLQLPKGQHAGPHGPVLCVLWLCEAAHHRPVDVPAAARRGRRLLGRAPRRRLPGVDRV